MLASAENLVPRLSLASTSGTRRTPSSSLSLAFHTERDNDPKFSDYNNFSFLFFTLLFISFDFDLISMIPLHLSCSTRPCEQSSPSQTLSVAQSAESTTPNTLPPIALVPFDNAVAPVSPLHSLTRRHCSAAVESTAVECRSDRGRQSMHHVPANILLETSPSPARPPVVHLSSFFTHSSRCSPPNSSSIAPLSVTFVTHSGVNLSGTSIKYCHSASRKRAA